MKINEIDISGFKGIPNIIIHPKQINILVGKNNTGKTSILEAISSTLEANINNLQMKYGEHLSSFINVNRTESKVVVKLENENRYIFLRKPELTEIIPEFKKQLINRLKVLSRTLHHIPGEGEWKKAEDLLDKILTNVSLLHKIKDESIRIESGNNISYIFSYTSLILKEIEPLVKYINEDIFHMNLTPFLYLLKEPNFFYMPADENHEKALAFIKDLAVRGIKETNKSKINEIENYLKERKICENLERFDIDKLLFKRNGKEYEIPFSFMGDGFKSLIGLIMRTSKNTQIILMEEPENHMHPAYITEIIRQIIDFSIINNIQFFITTHNCDILDVVSRDLIEPRYQTYLSKELNIIKLDYLHDDIMVQELNRDAALEELEDLKIDLRGR